MVLAFLAYGMLATESLARPDIMAEQGIALGAIQDCLIEKAAAEAPFRECKTVEFNHGCLDRGNSLNVCLDAESSVWNIVTEEEFRRTFVYSAEEDSRETSEQYSRRITALCRSQRAWREYKQAECDRRSAAWGQGSMRRTERLGCSMNMNVDRAFELRATRLRLPQQIDTFGDAPLVSAEELEARFETWCPFEEERP